MIPSKYLFLSCAASALILLSTGCKRKGDPNFHIHAAQLFNKSRTLLKAYTDSLQNATDSAHVEQLARSFENKINAVNFEFPPDTDLRLTQEENDSLIKMTDRLVEARRKRLYHFAHPVPDSISNPLPEPDSIVVPPSHSQHS